MHNYQSNIPYSRHPCASFRAQVSSCASFRAYRSVRNIPRAQPSVRILPCANFLVRIFPDPGTETGGTRYQYRTVPYRDETVLKKKEIGRYGTVRYAV